MEASRGDDAASSSPGAGVLQKFMKAVVLGDLQRSQDLLMRAVEMQDEIDDGVDDDDGALFGGEDDPDSVYPRANKGHVSCTRSSSRSSQRKGFTVDSVSHAVNLAVIAGMICRLAHLTLGLFLACACLTSLRRPSRLLLSSGRSASKFNQREVVKWLLEEEDPDLCYQVRMCVCVLVFPVSVCVPASFVSPFFCFLSMTT